MVEIKMVTDVFKNPVYTGTVSDGLMNKIGTIAIWNEIEPSSEKSPLFTGRIEVEGVKYRVALWKFVPKQV
jgi:hypothetical protein